MGTGWRLVIGDVITQFLIEAMTLSAIGGVIGVAVGLAIAALVRNVSPLATVPPLWSIAVGRNLHRSVFRNLPRDEAARLDPIEALRNE